MKDRLEEEARREADKVNGGKVAWNWQQYEDLKERGYYTVTRVTTLAVSIPIMAPPKDPADIPDKPENDLLQFVIN